MGWNDGKPDWNRHLNDVYSFPSLFGLLHAHIPLNRMDWAGPQSPPAAGKMDAQINVYCNSRINISRMLYDMYTMYNIIEWFVHIGLQVSNFSKYLFCRLLYLNPCPAAPRFHIPICLLHAGTCCGAWRAERCHSGLPVADLSHLSLRYHHQTLLVVPLWINH